MNEYQEHLLTEAPYTTVNSAWAHARIFLEVEKSILKKKLKLLC